MKQTEEKYQPWTGDIQMSYLISKITHSPKLHGCSSMQDGVCYTDRVSLRHSFTPSIKAGRDDVKGTRTNMEEVRQVIIALKDKLMERHLMSKKIAELEKILQKINDATNKIIIEMNNRIDDLNREWQERLQNENVKWKNDMHASYKYCNKLTESKSSHEINNGLWRMERRLVELTDRLSSIQKMEQKLEEIIAILRMNHCYQSFAANDKLPISGNESVVSTAKTAQNMQNDLNFYGVVEITENYSMVNIYFI
ncbi:unnamed protein product [Acanthocheilonema viteae]|uniref:Uncharacterized protein n=1 Tax=Acanthocheilonema viteae TaxID=6277 RepID=A0A498SC25_ACAVI|nr:unnamed protein product [Acanthocheilonema viteae]